MSDYELQVGDPVNVDIIVGGYWTDSRKGRVEKITAKRIGVRFWDGLRYYAPCHVSLNVKTIVQQVTHLRNARSSTTDPVKKETCNSQIRAFAERYNLYAMGLVFSDAAW